MREQRLVSMLLTAGAAADGPHPCGEVARPDHRGSNSDHRARASAAFATTPARTPVITASTTMMRIDA
jgi:hypothetical protein